MKLKLTLGRKIETASKNLRLLFSLPEKHDETTEAEKMKKNVGELGINNTV